MANKTYYKKGSQYVDVNGKAVMIAKGNQLTFTDYFDAGGGGELPVASASTLGGVKVGDGLNVTAGGVLSVAGGTYSTDEVDTGRKWIDGKNIYEKVVTLETALTVSRNGSDTGITPFHDTMISAKGNATNGACISFMEFVQDNTIHLACSNDFAVNNIIFEYTKPTPAEPAEPTNTRTVKKTVKKG